MGQQGLAAPTIRAYLSGVRQLQIARGFPDPEIGNMPRLKQVLRGVAVTKGMEGRSPARSRLPITPNILRRAWSKRPPKELHESLMLWAAACVTFFTFSRSGEMTVPDGSAFDPKLHLTISDVAIDKEEAPKVIAIRLKRSKTDQVGRGTSLVMGRTGIELCPVEALLRYIGHRGTQQGPLFQWRDGSPLTRSQFVMEVRKALTAAGLPAQNYAGHSFRIGVATTAATLGLEDSTIQTLGRWRSRAFLSYIRLGTGQLASLTRTLARGDL